ncbi:hypothetical protein E6C27_scaffold24705G00010 [Cucumis melo var. makuwa]|uniref:Uncharacterized protein n=1 Tax=Cucumis melo var. makuwa TaxID=1194695 RepID=A0A5A7TMN7_CUCMM|nr:hypothetical protein E6C27_scaffold24705G00010 [Cucumis melo var. makuwa]
MCCSSKHDDDSTSHPSTFEMTMVPREDEDGAVVPSPLQDTTTLYLYLSKKTTIVHLCLYLSKDEVIALSPPLQDENGTVPPLQNDGKAERRCPIVPTRMDGRSDDKCPSSPSRSLIADGRAERRCLIVHTREVDLTVNARSSSNRKVGSLMAKHNKDARSSPNRSWIADGRAKQRYPIVPSRTVDLMTNA